RVLERGAVGAAGEGDGELGPVVARRLEPGALPLHAGGTCADGGAVAAGEPGRGQARHQRRAGVADDGGLVVAVVHRGGAATGGGSGGHGGADVGGVVGQVVAAAGRQRRERSGHEGGGERAPDGCDDGRAGGSGAGHGPAG